MGRPLKFPDPKYIQARIDKYFKLCKQHIVKSKVIRYKDPKNKLEPYESIEKVVDSKAITLTGLCLFIGFSSLQQFSEYIEKAKYKDMLEKARTKVERYYEGKLMSSNVIGGIFALKNLAWKDKQEIDHNVKGVRIEDLID